MKVVKASYEIVSPLDGADILRSIEAAGRTCYKSEGLACEGSAEKFVAKIIKSGHHSVLEHCGFSVRFICDRGISHEIVRHRIASFSQESTRYCNYSKDKFGNELTFIDPRPHLKEPQMSLWRAAMQHCEAMYFGMVDAGTKPQMARSVLPNSLKTEIVMTANLREWRHFFALRTPKTAHPQIRELARPLLAEVRERVPVVFDDVGVLS